MSLCGFAWISLLRKLINYSQELFFTYKSVTNAEWQSKHLIHFRQISTKLKCTKSRCSYKTNVVVCAETPQYCIPFHKELHLAPLSLSKQQEQKKFGIHRVTQGPCTRSCILVRLKRSHSLCKLCSPFFFMALTMKSNQIILSNHTGSCDIP